MRKKLTNTVIAKLAVPEGKQSVKLFDTDVGGLGVRKMASGVATFIFEMRPRLGQQRCGKAPSNTAGSKDRPSYNDGNGAGSS